MKKFFEDAEPIKLNWFIKLILKTIKYSLCSFIWIGAKLKQL